MGETVYDFQWDPGKALSNASKHGVTFDQAASVFLDALALTVYDEANSQNEERWFTLGHDAGGRLLAVAHTYEIIGPAMFFCASFRPARRPDVNDVPTRMNRDR
jgi:uncharacterized DUF497 family protein